MGQRLICFVFLLVALWPFGACSERRSSQVNSNSTASGSVEPFVGRWDLSIKTPTVELPSWIEVSEEQGQPQVVMVGVSEHATPLAKVEIKDGELEFLSPKGEEGFTDDTLFKGKLVDDVLVGTTNGPGGASWQWTGRRAPALEHNGAPQWGTPVSLFNGKDFTGWKFSDLTRASSWTVEHGTLVSNGKGAEIISDSKFEDFKLHLEFNCGPKSNSGVYLRGRYEVQVENDSAEEPPSHHMGGVYGFLAPTP